MSTENIDKDLEVKNNLITIDNEVDKSDTALSSEKDVENNSEPEKVGGFFNIYKNLNVSKKSLDVFISVLLLGLTLTVILMAVL